MAGFVLLSFVVGYEVCLATLCSNTGRSRITRSVQEDGQRVHTDRSSEQRILAEKALTTLLQPARPVRFSQLLQALRHIQSSRNTSVQEEVSQERLRY